MSLDCSPWYDIWFWNELTDKNQPTLYLAPVIDQTFIINELLKARNIRDLSLVTSQRVLVIEKGRLLAVEVKRRTPDAARVSSIGFVARKQIRPTATGVWGARGFWPNASSAICLTCWTARWNPAGLRREMTSTALIYPGRKQSHKWLNSWSCCNNPKYIKRLVLWATYSLNTVQWIFLKPLPCIVRFYFCSPLRRGSIFKNYVGVEIAVKL